MSFNLTFRIYDAVTGGNKLWEETQSVPVSAGLFSTLLGNVAPLTLAFDQPYWVEIQVGAETLAPRQPLASGPYALRAAGLEGVTISSGNVGIGTPAPSQKLHVAGGGRFDGAGRVYVGAGAVVGSRGLEFIEENPTTFSIRHHDPNVAWRNIALNPHGGNVGIGTTDPAGFRLFVNGPAFATGGWQGSSVKLTTDLHRLSAQEEQALLAKLVKVPLFRYRLKKSDGLKNVHLGLIAEKSPAELVDDHHRAISYSDYLATLLAAVKAQQAQIETQQEQIETLQVELLRLKKRR